MLIIIMKSYYNHKGVLMKLNLGIIPEYIKTNAILQAICEMDVTDIKLPDEIELPTLSKEEQEIVDNAIAYCEANPDNGEMYELI